jgi:hypothetical protein
MMDAMSQIYQQAMAQIGEPSALFTSAKIFIEERFGAPGLIASGILLLAIIGLILSKAVKLSFAVVRYVVVPSIAVTFVATYFLPYSFVYILPATVAFFSILLIAKG